ncbi:FIST C-terminal domain-containing protein [Photobacterium japonica]|uniref:FIST signal transduction protein n=1 Tax=Photobacterium japonica TaxID=2910235 RepID=UPI003D0E9684
MDISTSFSSNSSSSGAIAQAIALLQQKITNPKLILVYFSENYAVDTFQQALTAAFPYAQILGCTSCQGVMTDDGYHFGTGVALWAISDYNGAYGSAIVSSHRPKYEMAKQALLKAITNSGRSGELPSLIVLHASPGDEEEVIRGINDELGISVPIIGGSAADDYILGNWQIFTHEQTCQEGVGLSVIYPSCLVSYSFHSGYASTGLHAVATRVEGRELLELDGRPAIEVYEEWMNTRLSQGVNLAKSSSLHPLGRVVGHVHDMPYFKLAHPREITQRGGIKLFARIHKGETLYFMKGTDERLITRAGRVVDAACNIYSEDSLLEPIGGITIYCAGCMLRVQDRMHEVAGHVNDAMHNAPFVGPFTFGEQGQFEGGENAHGNLMISAVLFHKD